MGKGWIDDVLRLNTRIIAAEAVASAQATAIVEMMEVGEDTAKAEELYRAYRADLRWLRGLRDIMLDEVTDDV